MEAGKSEIRVEWVWNRGKIGLGMGANRSETRLGKGRHPGKNHFTFGHFPKGGGGSTQIQKFWDSFFGAFFWTFSKKGGGVELVSKGLG